MPPKDFDRRAFLKAAAAAGALTLFGPTTRLASAAGLTGYLSACRLPDGSYAAVELDAAGRVIRIMPLPGRGHGFATASASGRAVAFARYPKSFAVAFELGGRGEPAVFAAPEGRHFYGHGVFADAGRLILATENDFDAARGVIGVYDVAAGYRRIGEFDTGGVGPHEVVMMPDGHTIAVANGGIETHPDFGDAKLNVATMSPSLAFIDTRSGDIRATHRLDASLHQVSIRHLAVDALGAVWFGCQYEGPAGDRPPVIGRATADRAPIMIEDPALSVALRHDIGSVAATADGQTIAAASPSGGAIVLVDLRGEVIGLRQLKNGCGLAPLDRSSLIATSSDGAVVELAPDGADLDLAVVDLSFDNHIALASV